MLVNFSPVESTKLVKGTCHYCGKKLQKTFKAMQTQNPFNKVGKFIKSKSQIYSENQEQIENEIENSYLICKKMLF